MDLKSEHGRKRVTIKARVGEWLIRDPEERKLFVQPFPKEIGSYFVICLELIKVGLRR